MVILGHSAIIAIFRRMRLQSSISSFGGMPISRIVEECKRRWDLVKSGEIDYKDPQRMGQSR